MAKGKRGGKKRASKKTARKSSKRERTAKTMKIIQQRLSLHEKAAQRPDFHGGKLPVRSGCGRPRGS